MNEHLHCGVVVSLLLLLVGCREISTEIPTVNLPVELRQENWFGNQGQGSCVYAASVSLLRWQGQTAKARRLLAYGNGAGPTSFKQVLNAEGIQFAQTRTGDEAFLELACKTRRGAAVVVDGGRHMVALVYLDHEYAGILDNNQIDRFSYIPRKVFMADWKISGGWAVAFLGPPTPPQPCNSTM